MNGTEHIIFDKSVGKDSRGWTIKGLKGELLTCFGCGGSVFDQLKEVFDQGGEVSRVFPIGLGSVSDKDYLDLE